MKRYDTLRYVARPLVGCHFEKSRDRSKLNVALLTMSKKSTNLPEKLLVAIWWPMPHKCLKYADCCFAIPFCLLLYNLGIAEGPADLLALCNAVLQWEVSLGSRLL